MANTDEIRKLIEVIKDNLFDARGQFEGTVGNQSINDSYRSTILALRNIKHLKKLQSRLNKKWHTKNTLRSVS